MFTSELKKRGYSKQVTIKLVNKCIMEGYLADFMRESKGDIMDILEVMADTSLWQKRYEENVQREIDNLLEAEKSNLVNLLGKRIVKILRTYQGLGMSRDEAKKEISSTFNLREDKAK